jgi:hypothetical protein
MATGAGAIAPPVRGASGTGVERRSAARAVTVTWSGGATTGVGTADGVSGAAAMTGGVGAAAAAVSEDGGAGGSVGALRQAAAAAMTAAAATTADRTEGDRTGIVDIGRDIEASSRSAMDQGPMMCEDSVQLVGH